MPIDIRTAARFKRRWDRLRGRGNDVDFDRAEMLNDIWHRLNEHPKNTHDWIVAELEEFPGKRCRRYIRMAIAYDSITDRETWQKVGTSGTIMLARLNRRQKRQVLRRVDTVLGNTGRVTVSDGTFRTIAQQALGDDIYKSLLVERSRRCTLKAKLEAACYERDLLKGFLICEYRRDRSIRDRMSPAVRYSLGLDTPRRRRAG